MATGHLTSAATHEKVESTSGLATESATHCKRESDHPTIESGAIRAGSMTFIDYFNPCPHCGGTLVYRIHDNGREDASTGRWQGETQYKYECRYCETEGDWRRVRANAIESMKPRERMADERALSRRLP